jgi:hypothetical protein
MMNYFTYYLKYSDTLTTLNSNIRIHSLQYKWGLHKRIYFAFLKKIIGV